MASTATIIDARTTERLNFVILELLSESTRGKNMPCAFRDLGATTTRDVDGVQAFGQDDRRAS